MKRTTFLLLAAWAALPLAAQAGPEPLPPHLAVTLPVHLPFLAELHVAADETTPAWGKKVDLAALDASESRGASDAIRNEATLGGAVASNSATNVSSGSNVIDSGSFAHASGLPVVIQNSGANVLIQNATVINLQLH